MPTVIPTPIMEEIRRLSIAERILLAQDIWDSIPDEELELSLTEAQREELKRRVEACNRSPHEGSSWEDVKKRIRERHR